MAMAAVASRVFAAGSEATDRIGEGGACWHSSKGCRGRPPPNKKRGHRPCTFVPRSKQCPERRKPPTLRRELTFNTLEQMWTKSATKGRSQARSKHLKVGPLGWYEVPSWRTPAAPLLTGKRQFIPRLAKTLQLLVESGCGCGLVDAKHVFTCVQTRETRGAPANSLDCQRGNACEERMHQPTLWTANGNAHVKHDMPYSD